MNINLLKNIIPDNVWNQLPDVISKFELNTSLRLAHFLAQCAHESGDFKVVQENLNYSDVGLLKIFPKYFDANSAKIYARNPEKIANRVYANRMGNGTEQSGDGWKHRGFGYIQTTGKQNQDSFAEYIKDSAIKTTPELIATKYPLLSAAWFFHTNNLHKIADEGSSEAVITKITKRINGGTIGLEDRIKHFNTYYNELKKGDV